MTRSEVAGRAGVHPETVRYYERRGLLPEPPRDERGYRRYDREAARRLYFIRRAKELGLSLSSVETLLALPRSPDDGPSARRAAAAELQRIRSMRRTLERIQGALEELLRVSSGMDLGQGCTFLDVLELPLDEPTS